MKKLLQMISVLVLLTVQIYAQDRSVTGTVKSKTDGQPIPGVTVRVPGTQQGTVTNNEGRFTISVGTAVKTLEASYVGFVTQQITIPASNRIDVALAEDSQQLDLVVVTALGISRKKNELPFAAQEVKAEEITMTRNNNLVNSLGGKVAGLDIKRSNAMGGSTNVVIRGAKSISGNNQALFVVDGVPVSNASANTLNQQTGRAGYDYGNAAADINPDDVASVTVLKGAAATALYGSRASNGVIIITTKKGSKNSTNVTVNSGVTFGSIDKSTFIEYQKEYGQGYNSPATDGPGNVVPAPGFWYRDVFGTGRVMTPQFSSDASYGPRFDPNLLVYQWSALDPFSPNYQKATPWVAAANDPSTFYKTSVASNQSISIDGGGDKGTYKIGYTRNDETGVLPNSKITKNLFNFGGSYEIVKDLTVTSSVNYSKIDGLGRFGTGYSGLNPNQGFRQWWNVGADIKELKEAYERNNKNVSWNWSDATGTKPIYADNPYFSRYQNFENDTRDHYFGNTSLNYKVNDWFDVIGRVSYDGTFDLQEERIAVGSTGVASYSRTNGTFAETNFDLLLNFNKNITEDFSFKGLLGANLRRSKLTNINARTNGGLVVPNLYSLSNSVSAIEAPVELYERRAVDGYFASTTFGYKDLVFLDATIRRDQSTTLPTNKNVFWYPSIAGSFAFSNLLKDVSWLSYGKLRVNYAEVGSDAPPLSVFDTYAKPTAFGSIPMFSMADVKNNANLKPERTKSVEAGLDAAFLDNRLGFDVTFYKTNTIDQITPVPVTTATGSLRLYVNAGEVQNKGVEVSAFVVPVKTSNFSWTLNLNWSRNQSKVLSLFENVSNIELNAASLSGGVTYNAAIGQPYGVIRGTNFVFVNGQKVVNADGYYQVTPRADEIIGDPNPDWMGGISNTFKYKRVALNFLIDIRKGGDLWTLDQWYGLGTGMSPETAGLNDLGNPLRNSLADGGGVILPGVLADGSPNTKRIDVSNSGTAPWGYPNNPPRASVIYDAGYVKLRELALTYSLPEKLVGKLRAFKGIDLSLIGRNLWIIHKNVPYADPEDGLGSGNVQGYQSGAYPTVRSIGFNVKFRL
ncbi:SusC/RagA family TonB-linked outer membrane protein [Pedobacter quisquiliarum]|uniref:SusC/RagA family TonB-linked outer membrane protein n=1 Tax=Pedobacter quisquiliarum TaxID=1834438 RepID=A0A916U0Z9_9SPHI|nr:SusC/RagA family TonB-linked outer membrane protein [Pedobacter quisquiliarum]GGC55418.1 SusC/RagA family TonB-linked outer membrane protein [Pedobacter quisquiliarum]